MIINYDNRLETSRWKAYAARFSRSQADVTFGKAYRRDQVGTTIAGSLPNPALTLQTPQGEFASPAVYRPYAPPAIIAEKGYSGEFPYSLMPKITVPLPWLRKK